MSDATKQNDWTTPAAMALPEQGYFTLEQGWPEAWKTNPEAVIKFFRDHQRPSFLEYGEYPFVTADEVKKALRLKAAFSAMPDEMQ